MANPYPWTIGQTGVDPSDHSARHENGGADEVSVAGLSGLLADDQHVLDAEVTAVAIAKATVDAQSVLGGVADDTPVAIVVAEQTLVGRITGGNVTALTKAQVRTLLADYAHMFVEDNTTAMTIQAANAWHLMSGMGAGELSGNWSFTNGATKAITAYATSDGGTKTQVTSAGHGMANGDIISIAGTTSYDGVWIIEQVAADTFVISTAFVADDGASTGEYGAFLKSTDASATGKYMVTMSCTMTNATLSDVIEMRVFLNATQQSGSICRITMGTPGAFVTSAQSSIVDYTNGDRLVMGMRNVGGTGNFTMRNCSVVITRIG